VTRELMTCERQHLVSTDTRGGHSVPERSTEVSKPGRLLGTPAVGIQAPCLCCVLCPKQCRMFDTLTTESLGSLSTR
jgi:hypothetical protein